MKNNNWMSKFTFSIMSISGHYQAELPVETAIKLQHSQLAFFKDGTSRSPSGRTHLATTLARGPLFTACLLAALLSKALPLYHVISSQSQAMGNWRAPSRQFCSRGGLWPPLSLPHLFGAESHYLEVLRVEVCLEGSTRSLPANLHVSPSSTCFISRHLMERVMLCNFMSAFFF